MNREAQARSRAEQPFLSLALPSNNHRRLSPITPSCHQHQQKRCIAAGAAAAAAAGTRASRCRRAAAGPAEPLVTSFIQNQKQVEAFPAGLRAQPLPALRLLLMH